MSQCKARKFQQLFLCAFLMLSELSPAGSQGVPFTYLGCYVDAPSRDLTGLQGLTTVGNYTVQSVGAVDMNTMTWEICSDVCSIGRFLYFGVQVGTQCYCGNTYGSKGNATDCSFQCRGNPALTCGGNYRNTVFALNYTNSTPAVAPTPSFTFKYVGCFADSGTRDLNGLVNVIQLSNFTIQSSGGVSSSSMTQEYCSTVCALGRFTYFGVQYGGECYCGNSYGSQGTGGSCWSQCIGNVAQTCGGSNQNSVFRLTYNYPNLFVKFDGRRNVTTTAAYTQSAYWTSTGATSKIDCLARCAVGCQGVLFGQQQSACYLLRFAAVPTELANQAGELFVRG